MSKIKKSAEKYIHELENMFREPDEIKPLESYDESIIVEYEEDFNGWYSSTRRPYYRLRGHKVTEEQAFEIIARTDRTFDYIEDKQTGRKICLEKHVETFDLQNRWFINNIVPRYSGWCHPDGTIGTNGITGKYPDLSELLSVLCILINAFPYIDFVWAITDWNEIPDRCWDALYDEDSEDSEEDSENYPDFIEHIDIAFHVHDKKIEILTGEQAVEIYTEYNKKYGGDEKRFTESYYDELGESPVDINYLKRCLDYYGLALENVEFLYNIIDK